MSFNTFGHLFRVTTFGESHGPAIGCVVDGCPPRIALERSRHPALSRRRRPGQSRFTTQRQEPDAIKILSGVFFDETTGRQVTTGTPIALLIENVDQRCKDYSDIKDKYRPGHADFTYDVKYGLRDYRGGGRHRRARRRCGSRRAPSRARSCPTLHVRGALVQMGPHRIDRARWDWAEVERNPFFCPDADKAAFFADYLDGVRKTRLLDRRGHRDRRRRRAGRARRADLWQARRRSRRGADEHQCRQGRRDRRRLCRRGAVRRRKCRRDAHGQRRQAAVSLQQCRRHSRRHFDRPAGRGALCGQADLLDPHAAPHRRPLRQRDRDLDQRPPRSLRRHPRRAGRRSHGGVRDCRSLSAPSRPGRRQRPAWPFPPASI